MPSAEPADSLAAPCALALAAPATPFESAREPDGASSAELGFAGSDGLGSALVAVAAFAALDVADGFESSARAADVGSFERSSSFESLDAAADVESLELAADFVSVELVVTLESLALGADSSLLPLVARSTSRSLVADSELLPIVAAASVVALGAGCVAAFMLGDGTIPSDSASASDCASSVQFASLAIGAVSAKTVGASALPARAASFDCGVPPIAASALDSFAERSLPCALAPPPASGTRK